MYPFKIFTGVAHERVTKASKVCAVFHFLCGCISNIAFTTDVGDCEGTVGHPFSNRIFSVFDETISCSGHVVASLDASIIIVVKVSWEICIGDGVT
jgi:hypothetical protein